VTSDTSSKYGKVMRVSSTASPNRPGSREKPGASRPMTVGVKISAIASSASSTANSSVKMRSANSAAGPTPPAVRMRA